MKSTIDGKGMGMGGTMTSTTYVKGSKMRTDVVMGDTTRTTIFDLDTQKMISFDSKKKEADVYDMQEFGADMAKSVQVSEHESLDQGERQDQADRRQVGDRLRHGDQRPRHDGRRRRHEDDREPEGPMWIVKGAPGTAEYLAFYKSAVDKGWFFSDPRAAKAQPGQAKAMAEMYTPARSDRRHPVRAGDERQDERRGPDGGVLAKMGNISMTTTVQSVETGALAADLFAVPAGYKLKEQK